MEEQITAERLLEEIKPIIKDCFVAIVHQNSDGLSLRFPSGQKFTVAVWENKKNS
ncbi:MAG: hypothetical protein K2N74_05665 [Clostridiales bacterium]|nr:hypothetical protein [Clostridiales bacterium]